MTLTRSSPLGGYAESFDGVTLAEVTDLALVSVAMPLKGDAKHKKAMKEGLGLDWPKVGASTLSKDGKTRALGLGADQIFLAFSSASPAPEAGVAKALKGAGYTTDQSDVWVALRIEGPRARAALERICPLDLHADAFAEGAVARSVMEHMGAVILREKGDRFLLLSASSSAGSFLHAVETSVKNIL